MTKKLLLNLLLTIVWMALTGKLSLINFVFGFVISFFILWMISGKNEDQRYFNRFPKIMAFIIYFLYKLLRANLQVAYYVIIPQFNMKPGIVGIPLDAKTDLEITLLANVITLTPGTLSLDVSDDRKVLYVHAMYIKNREEFIQGIKTGFEKKLLEILR